MASTRIAKRLAQVASSATLALAQRAREMQARGIDVVSLTAGEPDFQPARHVLDAAKQALDAGRTKYTAVTGIPELRDAVRASIEREDGVRFSREQVVVSSGAKQAIYNATLAVIDPGDEVLIIAPYWLSYRDIVLVAEGTPKILETSEASDFLLDPAALEAAIGPRTRMVILNSPSNPAGAAYGAAHLRALGEVLLRHPQVLILSDDIYRRIYFKGPLAPSLLSVAPELAPRTIVIGGCSKTFAMTGFRIGWAAAQDDALVDAMSRLQGQATSNANTPSQYAALAALTGDQRWVDEMVATFDARRRVIVAGLGRIPGVRCFDPAGAFYAFPSFAELFGKRLPGGAILEDTEQLAAHLLETHHLVGVPGAPFGSTRHLRFSFATDLPTIEKALARLDTAVRALV
ncbi:MAG: pyridoxal phosphate-dependent aminotransferase [Deltaproteobacteria bacterium]|nr:pyridoxal phosphate-dependent aminotransferase [Deltaproteobacteria bacterium]